MDKIGLETKMKELEELKIKIKKKEKEVDAQLTELRFQYYKIIEEENKKRKEEELKNPPDTSFLNEAEWSGFD